MEDRGVGDELAIGRCSANRIGDAARLPQLLFNGIVRPFRPAPQLVRTLEVKCQLLLELAHTADARRST